MASDLDGWPGAERRYPPPPGRGAARRPRSRFDARRAGLPPVSGGLLALDAHGAAAPLRVERRVVRADGRARGRDRLDPRDAAWHLPRDRAPADGARTA